MKILSFGEKSPADTLPKMRSGYSNLSGQKCRAMPNSADRSQLMFLLFPLKTIIYLQSLGDCRLGTANYNKPLYGSPLDVVTGLGPHMLPLRRDDTVFV